MMTEQTEAQDTIIYEYTDPVYSREDNTAIDMIWDHPEHGPIPFTLIEDDYPDFWAKVIAEGNIAPYVEP